ncbi:hypothetical protein NDU88_000138 [Pleurodeles waltl]|uniref:Uncharacterized protein n=1 Tax=Pleurodeles waltl TaxID=8319 RepID=A0AAV7KNS1_PLEWA|nr:hypothetical protein NDU88_000138 [Pleurodeles waltl]
MNPASPPDRTITCASVFCRGDTPLTRPALNKPLFPTIEKQRPEKAGGAKRNRVVCGTGRAERRTKMEETDQRRPGRDSAFYELMLYCNTNLNFS